MAKISRQRGANYEREVSNEIFDMLGVRIKRNLKQYQQSGEGDLILGDYVIECKRRRSIAVYDWMRQADEASAPWQTPIVVMRADGEKSLAVMHLPDLLKLLGNEIPHQSQDESPSGDS
jgi:N-dimethylarginine dimethylaminohydrolase